MNVSAYERLSVCAETCFLAMTHLNEKRLQRESRVLPEFVFGIFEALGYVVDGLVLLILVGLNRSGSRVEGPMFRLVTEGVQQFTNGREHSRTIHLQLLVLLAETEFNGKPVYLRKENIQWKLIVQPKTARVNNT